MNKALIPTDTGEVVTTFLEDNLGDYISDTFTAEMEDKLDNIAEGKATYLDTLKKFYGPFLKDVKSKESLAKATNLGVTSNMIRKVLVAIGGIIIFLIAIILLVTPSHGATGTTADHRLIQVERIWKKFDPNLMLSRDGLTSAGYEVFFPGRDIAKGLYEWRRMTPYLIGLIEEAKKEYEAGNVKKFDNADDFLAALNK
jgi:hypothetical protein